MLIRSLASYSISSPKNEPARLKANCIAHDGLHHCFNVEGDRGGRVILSKFPMESGPLVTSQSPSRACTCVVALRYHPTLRHYLIIVAIIVACYDYM